MRKINIPKDLLLELYVEKDLTTYQIANELGVSRQTVCNKLKGFNIDIKDTKYKSILKKSKLPKNIPKYHNKEDFQKIYLELKSVNLVAEHYGIGIDTAYNWKNKHGIETITELSEVGITKLNEGKPWTSKDYLSKMYNKYSIYDLAKIWNCSPTTISKWLKRHGIPTKTYSEQWDRKSKNGARVLKGDGFDLQEYNNTYAIKGHLSRRVVEDIKEVVGKCQSCDENEVLDLHHINENSKDNRPENHIILCPNCHAKIHRLGITVEELCPDFKDWSTILNDTYAEAK